MGIYLGVLAGDQMHSPKYFGQYSYINLYLLLAWDAKAQSCGRDFPLAFIPPKRNFTPTGQWFPWNEQHNSREWGCPRTPTLPMQAFPGAGFYTWRITTAILNICMVIFSQMCLP